MKEKRKKDKRKSHKKDKKREKRRSTSSSSSSTSSDEWVEKEPVQKQIVERDDWMSMTGMLKTYTKDDLRPKKDDKNKKHIDSYNPSTSSRELNPYWKDGGSGLPKTAENFRKSAQYLKPPDEDDYYSKSSNSKSSSQNRLYDKSRQYLKPCDDDDEDYYKKSKNSSKTINTDKSGEYLNHSDDYRKPSSSSRDYKDSRKHIDRKSYNWKKGDSNEKKGDVSLEKDREPAQAINSLKNNDRMLYNWKKGDGNGKKPADGSCDVSLEKIIEPAQAMNNHKDNEGNKYLSDEKMNKLAAKILKAEIMGDTKVVEMLKAKLEAARLYRKQNPDSQEVEEDESVMLISTNSSGNSRPLVNSSKGDARSKGGKRKAETHMSGERAKYFGNDDKYNLAQMFQNEKYGNNYNDDAELARIASKSKNPNDDLEDIFVDEISKNRNEAKDHEAEKNRAINQHVKMEKSLEGCEYCVDSKNMLKHLMVSCGNKVYVALPSRKSMVKDQCLITTIQHATCVTALDEDVWEEILNYRRAITQFFNSQNKDVVFFETATRLHKFPHMVINCVPLPRDVGDMAAIYFKKALLECEAEWSMNKKVVDLKGKNIRKGVPKGLPYFWIDFGMDPGFAHVIEDQQLFPRNFAQEIIGGILDLDHNLWKNPRREYGDLQRKKVVDFLKDWRSFDPVENTNST